VRKKWNDRRSFSLPIISREGDLARAQEVDLEVNLLFIGLRFVSIAFAASGNAPLTMGLAFVTLHVSDCYGKEYEWLVESQP
jgi:hypothetical protein